MIRFASSLLVWLTLAPTGVADAVPPSSVEGRAVALTAALIAPPGMPFVVGVRARGTAVRLRNDDPVRAVALRSVAWRFGLPSANWLVPIQGRTTAQRDGTIQLDPLAQNLTELRFEHGLLLPGEEVVVPLVLPVRSGPTQRLDVEYAVVGDEIRGWRTEILLPRQEELSHATYGAITTDALETRRREGGGRALARSTMKEGYLPLGEGRARFELPVQTTTDDARTGGTDAADAAAQAGDDPDASVAWVRGLRAWLVVGEGGRAVMVGRDGAVQLGDGWSPLVAAVVNADGEGNTRALLRPDVFEDITPVARPTYNRYFDAGATLLDSKTLRQVFERARERDLPVRVVTVDPNGFGVVHLLTVGVTVDGRGRWQDPAIEPDED